MTGTLLLDHLRKLCQSMFGRINLLRALVGTTFGWHTFGHRQIYIANIRSILEYAYRNVSYQDGTHRLARFRSSHHCALRHWQHLVGITEDAV